MFFDDPLIEQVRNADPMLINELIRALCHRCDEVNPDYTLTFFVVDKKRTFEEQADEYITFMQRLKETKVRKPQNSKTIPFRPNK